MPLRLGNATIDPVSREARWVGGKERLQPQTLKVLIVLAAHRGEVVTRDELMQRCWDGRVVGDDVINRCISLLRHFADRTGEFGIETVPKAGYKLLEKDPSSGEARRWQTASVAVVLVTALAAVAALSRHPPSQTSSLRLAMSPFAATSADSRARMLAAASEDAVVRMLTESGVSVEPIRAGRAPRTRPDFILLGSVTSDSTRPVVTVRLEDPERNVVVLSRQVEAAPENEEALPDRVGATLSAALSWIAPVVRLERIQKSDPAFLANFMRINETNFDGQRSFEFLRRHAPQARGSALAQFAFARSTGMNIMEIPPVERPAALRAGREAAARALRLAPHYGDAYIPWCLLHAEVRLIECEERLRKGMKVDPSAPFAGSVLAHLLHNVGKVDDGTSLATEVLAKDAYVPGKMASLLELLEANGQASEAGSLFTRSRRLWPNYPNLIIKRAAGIIARGDFDALDRFERSLGPSALPEGYKALGDLAAASRQNSLKEALANCPADAGDQRKVECMILLARLGDLDRAFALAAALYPRRTARDGAAEDALWLVHPDNLDTMFITGNGSAPLRRDPRYLDLARRVGLARYWRARGLPDFCRSIHEPVCEKLNA